MAFNKSVFRFAQGATNNDQVMTLKAPGVPGGQCFGVTASSKWVASVYGNGGSVVVLPMDYDKYQRNDDPPLVTTPRTYARHTPHQPSPHNRSRSAHEHNTQVPDDIDALARCVPTARRWATSSSAPGTRTSS